MIEGHGDDAYRYAAISSDFSSNICATEAPRALMAHLARQPQLLAHYPEPEAWSIERLIARRLGIGADSVVVTGGATEAIYLVAQAFPYQAVIPSPTFREYEDACACFARREGQTALWLCNPNNPDGRCYTTDHIWQQAERHDLVVVDSSYEHYTAAPLPSAQQCCRHERLLQIHSFTKAYGVPGLRLGFVTAHPHLTAALRRYMRPWSVSALAVEAGKFLLLHDELRCHPDLGEAQRLRQRLIGIGVDVAPTQTNFMLCRLHRHTAAALKDHLARSHRLLIRDASNFHGLTGHHFRVAAQTPDENDTLVEAIRQFLDTQSAQG